MKKLKINKKIITIATYTIAILSAISFAIYPETNAIFKKDNEKALAYTSSLEMTYTGSFKPVLNREDSTSNVARITLTLPRDDRYIKEGEKYTIEAISKTPFNLEKPETVCTIVTPPKSNNIKIDSDNNITFTNKENGVIDIECNIEANKVNSENLKIAIKYYEKVLDEEKFLFQQGTFTMDYNEYMEPYKEPPIDSIIEIKNEDGTDKSTEDIYKEFMGLITKHIENSEYAKNYKLTIGLFEEYINDYGITEGTAKSILIDALDFSLLGVTRTPVKNEEDDSLKGYAFEFDENFVGYGKTNNWFRDYNKNGDRIYFSTEDKVKLELALKNSIDKWAFKENTKTYNIDGNSYTSSSLVIKYIDEYIKANNLEYSISILSKIPGLYSGKDASGYPYLGFRPTIYDYAYNYLSKDNKIIRVSYYETLSEDIALTYIQGIAGAGITNIYKTENPYFANVLIENLYNNSDFYKAVTCRKTCEDYTDIYYNNGKYYQVIVTHNETEKYNEIKIVEKNLLEDVLTDLFDENVITGIMNNFTEGSLLNKAITCNTTTCEEYNEIYYNTNSGEYILIKVSPNNTYKVNNIKFSYYEDIDFIENIYSEELLNSIMVSYEEANLSNFENQNPSTKLYDLHYVDGKYYLMEIIFDSNGCNSFIVYNGSIDELLEKISVNSKFAIYTLDANKEIINDLINELTNYTKISQITPGNTDYVIISVQKNA